MTRTEKLEELARYYCSTLCEDPIDGTAFDCTILNAIEILKQEFKQKNPRDQYTVILGAIEGTLSNYEDAIIESKEFMMQIQIYLNNLKKLSKYMKEEW